jgi:hypothetical protein
MELQQREAAKSQIAMNRKGEQAVALGAAGRAVLKWKVVRRGPVNGVVRFQGAWCVT